MGGILLLIIPVMDLQTAAFRPERNPGAKESVMSNLTASGPQASGRVAPVQRSWPTPPPAHGFSPAHGYSPAPGYIPVQGYRAPARYGPPTTTPMKSAGGWWATKLVAAVVFTVLLGGGGCAALGTHTTHPPRGEKLSEAHLDQLTTTVSTDNPATSDLGEQSSGSVPPGGAAAGRLGLLTEVTGELAAMRETRYQHTTDVHPELGQFFYDCSGLLDYALSRSRPDDLRALPISTSERPLARDFVSQLQQAAAGASSGLWRPVGTVAALLPGDVIAWLATPDSRTRDTGHVMVVLEAPVPNPVRADEWLVKVADSTVSPHAQDSRTLSDEEGLGTGTVGLHVDSSGRATGFYWRGGQSQTLKLTEITLGEPG